MPRFSKGIEVITLWVAVDDYGNPSAIPNALDFKIRHHHPIVPAVEGMGDKGISLIDYRSNLMDYVDSEMARLVMQPGRWQPVAKEDSGKGTDDA
jgi:hypothetical protein